MSTSPRRALVVSQPTSEGVAVGVLGVVEGAVERGWDVTVVSPSTGWLGDAVRRVGAHWNRLDMARQPNPADAWHVVVLRQFLGDVDVVHLHSSKAGALGRLAIASLPGGRRPACIFTPHAWSWSVGGQLARVYQGFERLTAPLADAVISVSEEEQVEGLARLGRRVGDRLRVVANGVDPMAFSPDGAIAARSSVPLVVCVGRLSRQKGQDVAIRALALARTPLVRLRLIGDGPERDRLQALATATGVRDRLEMTGNVTDPATHLRAADLVVIPSRWDGLSFSLLEAMACQRAVIATHVGGTGVLGPAGRLVPADDPVQMARCMDDLLGDAAAREAMGRAGRALVERDYTRAESVRRTLDIWDEVTNPRGCGPASNDARRRRIRRVRAPGR